MIDHRAITRLPCQRAVRFDKVQGFFTDIGLGGARLVSPIALSEGDRIEVRPQHKSAGITPIAFEVRWCHHSDPDFDESTEAFQIGLAVRVSMPEFVQSWVSDLLADQGLRPEQIAQRRRWLRVQTEIGARCAALEDEDMDPCVIQDLSVGGAAVRSKLLLTADAPLRLGLPAQPGTPSLVMTGKVVSRRRAKNAWLYGVMFTDLSSSQLSALEQLVERRIRGG